MRRSEFLRAIGLSSVCSNGFMRDWTGGNPTRYPDPDVILISPPIPICDEPVSNFKAPPGPAIEDPDWTMLVRLSMPDFPDLKIIFPDVEMELLEEMVIDPDRSSPCPVCTVMVPVSIFASGEEICNAPDCT